MQYKFMGNLISKEKIDLHQKQESKICFDTKVCVDETSGMNY